MEKQFRNVVKNKIMESLPPNQIGRPQKIDIDETLDIIFNIVKGGHQWRLVKSKNVSYTTIYRHANKWFKDNIFQKAYRIVLRWYRNHHPAKYYCIDSTMIKNQYGVDCKGRNPTDRGRNGTKLTTIVDQNGVTNSVLFTPANTSDCILLERTIQQCLEPLQRLEMLADRGYASRHNSQICRSYQLKDRIFRKKTKTTRRTNAKRGVIERSYCWGDKYRRLIMRYEKEINTYSEMLFISLSQTVCRRFLSAYVT